MRYSGIDVLGLCKQNILLVPEKPVMYAGDYLVANFDIVNAPIKMIQRASKHDGKYYSYCFSVEVMYNRLDNSYILNFFYTDSDFKRIKLNDLVDDFLYIHALEFGKFLIKMKLK